MTSKESSSEGGRNRSIGELWCESDRKTEEILREPLKHPIEYLKMLLFDGIPNLRPEEPKKKSS